MAQEYEPGEIMSQPGIYRVTHDPQHADMPHETTVIRGRRFLTRWHCEKGSSSNLATRPGTSAKIDDLEEAQATAG